MNIGMNISKVIPALCVALLAVAGAPAIAQTADGGAGKILGRWLTEPRDGIIEITVAGNGFEGRIIGGNDPGRLDAKNPDEALRGKPLRGQLILRGLGYDGEGSYSGGTIYDPDSGRTYKLKAELLADGTLKIRGFIGFALLGRTQIWTRYTGTSLDLPPAAK